MTVSTYEYEGSLLRAGDGVLEQFRRGVLGSKRIPIAWLAVRLEPRKHDQVLVEIGMSSGPGAPLYSDPAAREAAFNFEIRAAEEVNLRAFLDAAARDAGRSG